MRIVLAIILLLALVTVQATNHAAAAGSACSVTTCTITVSRVINTNDWGTTQVNDTVTVNATSPVAFLTLGLPSAVASNLRQMTASDTQGGTVQVAQLAQNQSDRDQPYQFTFPASKRGIYTFTISSVFSDLISFDPVTSKLTLSFSAFPVVDGTQNVAHANVTVFTRDWPSPIVNPGNHNVTGGKAFLRADPVMPFNATVWKIVFSSTGTTQNLFDANANRVVSISPSGSVSVSDTYNVTNRGKDVPNIVLGVPSGSSSISCNDVIGQLDATSCPFDGVAAVTFSPRFGTIKNNGAAVVTLQYTLPSNSYIASNGLGKYTLTFQMFNGVKFAAPSLQTKILAPNGFKLSTLTGQAPVVSGNQILLQASPVTPYSNLAFSMTYQLDPFWSSMNPLGWAGLAVGGIAAIALVLSSSSQGAVVGVTPFQLIGRFVELYDEKSSLRLEEDKLFEDLNRGAVSKHDYKRRRRVMDLRLSEIDKLLAPVKEQLSASQSRYADMIKRMEKAEAELQVVKSSLADLKNQNRIGRISRELYDQLSADLLRRKARAEQTLDNIIIGLREEAR